MDEDNAPRLADIDIESARVRCREAAETGNPLPYFVALKSLLSAALFRAFDEAEAAGASGEEALRKGFAADKNVRLPAELHQYLQTAVWRLSELEAGRDFQEYPADHPHVDAKWGTPEKAAYMEERRAYQNRSKHGGMRLAPDAAAKLVTRALYITRPGFNAFKISERQDWAAVAEEEEAAARTRGSPALQARLEAMERLGYQDERSFRRLKSGKPRRRGKPPR